jgi:hypothetical protein
MATSTSTPITVAHGDGIGPEIMAATLHILKEAGARLDIETIDAGEKVYLSGNTSGIDELALEMIANRGVRVWPDGSPQTFCTDAFRCRFYAPSATPKQIVALLGRVIDLGFEVAMTENLRN